MTAISPPASSGMGHDAMCTNRPHGNFNDEKWHNIPMVVRESMAQLFDERRALMATVESLRQKQAESEGMVKRVLQKQADMEVRLNQCCSAHNAPSLRSGKIGFAAGGASLGAAAADGGIADILLEQTGHLRRKLERQVTVGHRVELRLEALELKTKHDSSDQKARFDEEHQTLTDLTRQTNSLKQMVEDMHEREATLADNVKNALLLELRQKSTAHESAMTEHMSHMHTHSAELERDLRRTMAGIQATQVTLSAQIKDQDQVYATRQDSVLRATEELKALYESRWEGVTRQTAALQADYLRALSAQSSELRQAQLDTRRRVTRNEKKDHVQLTRIEEEVERMKQGNTGFAEKLEKRFTQTYQATAEQMHEMTSRLTHIEHTMQARQETSEARIDQMQRAHEMLSTRQNESDDLIGSLRSRIQHTEEQYDSVRALNERSDSALNQQYSRLVKALQELTEVHDKTEEQALHACSISSEVLRKLASLEQRCIDVERTCEDTQRHTSATVSSLPGKLGEIGEQVYTRAHAAAEAVRHACERSIESARERAVTSAKEHDARIACVEQTMQLLRQDLAQLQQLQAAVLHSSNTANTGESINAKNAAEANTSEKEALRAAVDSLRHRVEMMEKIPADTVDLTVALEELRAQYSTLSRQGARLNEDDLEAKVLQSMRTEMQEMHSNFSHIIQKRYGALTVELHQMDNHANTTEYALTKLSTDVTSVLERLLYVEEVLSTLRSAQDKKASAVSKDRVDAVEQAVEKQEARIAKLEYVRRELDESVYQLAWNKLLIASCSTSSMANANNNNNSNNSNTRPGQGLPLAATAAAMAVGSLPTDTNSVTPPSSWGADVWELRLAAVSDKQVTCVQRIDCLAESVACLREKLNRHEKVYKHHMDHHSHCEAEEAGNDTDTNKRNKDTKEKQNNEECARHVAVPADVLQLTTALVEDVQSRLRDNVATVQAMRRDVDELFDLYNNSRALIDQCTNDESELKRQLLDVAATHQQKQQQMLQEEEAARQQSASEARLQNTLIAKNVSELIRREMHDECVKVFDELRPEWQEKLVHACSLHSGVSVEQMQAHSDTLRKLSETVTKLAKKSSSAPQSSRGARKSIEKHPRNDAQDEGAGHVLAEATLLTLRNVAAQTVEKSVRDMCYTRPEMEERLENVWLSMIDLLARKEDVKCVDDKLLKLRHAIHDDLKEMLEKIID